jgi:O-antigen/teichoic acid export membrane protein
VMHRNYFFLRSITFSVVAKSAGFFVVFTCLPLAALALNSAEYATFNYSMSVASLLSIVFGPPSAFLIGQFARASAQGGGSSLPRLAENSLSVFLWLGLIAGPIAVCVSAFMSPAGFRTSLVLATVAVLMANTLSWADVFRLGLRKDHISSIFALGNNLSIITGFVLLYHLNRLSYDTVMLIYYACPLVWGALSFLQLIMSHGFGVRLIAPFDSCRRIVVDSLPLANSSLSDYIRLHVSSLVAFNLLPSADYNVYSTVTLLIARILNPITLLTRPLVPAYIDAIAANDMKWIRWFRAAMALLGLTLLAAALLSPVLLSALHVDGIRLGVIELSKAQIEFYGSFGVVLVGAQIYIGFLASIYLGAHRIVTFSNANLIANVVGVGVGILALPSFGSKGLFSAIAICNTLCAAYLAYPFFHDPVRLSLKRAGLGGEVGAP